MPGNADGTRIIGRARKGRTGGIGATARRCGTAFGAGEYSAEEVRVEPRAGRGSFVPLGNAHTAAHPKERNPGDVWRIATHPYRRSHMALPIGRPLQAIAAGCPHGDIVLDPFSGTGTAGLAALQLGRRYTDVDISAAFHDEILNRLAPHLPVGLSREESG
ncbi:DNA methyltransferase [Micromonospora haikouensis]|uniref:DNA methyltransferase n=1 Tax=Micromonospora haikouensis TaxID=686309 RepID=UPI0037B97298